MDAELVVDRLQREGFGFEWERVETREAYLLALATGPDLVLSDWNLPQFSGAEALRLLHEQGSDIPFVILSGTVGEDVAVAAMRDGADDYILKDRPARLGSAIRLALQTKQRRDAHRLESLGQLAGGVAHDFNNLLAVIMTFQTLASRRVSDPDVLADLAQIGAAAERAAALTRQMLAFARHEVFQQESLDVNAIVADLVAMLDRTLGSHIELVVDLSPGSPMATGDRHQIEQIVMNLAINARDAMPNGGRLTIATDRTVPFGQDMIGPGRANDQVLLRISDQGVGMTPEVIKRAFDPFFTTKARGQGTGLGLSTVYSIVRNSGGTVTIHSKVGTGTTITVLLPVAAAPAPQARQRASDSAMGGHEQILLVEDDEALRGAMARILADNGYRVLSAADGVAALEVFNLNAAAVDLVLTDIDMPRMRGDQLASELLCRRPGLRIIFMSGSHTRGFGVNVSAHLSKPVSPSDLLGSIRTALDEPASP